MEVRDIVQETGIKTIPEEKKCKKAKWLSEEALQIAVKRRDRGEGKHQRWGEGRPHTECFHKLALDSSSHQFCEALPSAVYSQGNSGRKRLTDW